MSIGQDWTTVGANVELHKGDVRIPGFSTYSRKVVGLMVGAEEDGNQDFWALSLALGTARLSGLGNTEYKVCDITQVLFYNHKSWQCHAGCGRS